ncbi:hypothetical protein KKE06_01935 [Candidatus Micrarchaeota archaeon]|nr:hypothetical protein [Candidatus Micrarchaeota archaeon]MBU1930605.1 hypothetical protein [Candidatus Micrarchaeota archaeon]
MALNYPVGDPIEEGLELEKIEPHSFLAKLFVPNFSGYVVITLEGYSGIEEGVLFFQEGTGVGAAFSYDSFDTAVFGDTALNSFFNGLAAKKGVADVFKLSKQQVDLILALDERTAIRTPLVQDMVSKKIRNQYNASFAQAAVRGLDTVVTHSSDLLKKIGLGEMAK